MARKKGQVNPELAAGRIAGLREARKLLTDALRASNPHQTIGLDKAVGLVQDRLWEAQRAAGLERD